MSEGAKREVNIKNSQKQLQRYDAPTYKRKLFPVSVFKNQEPALIQYTEPPLEIKLQSFYDTQVVKIISKRERKTTS